MYILQTFVSFDDWFVSIDHGRKTMRVIGCQTYNKDKTVSIDLSRTAQN